MGSAGAGSCNCNMVDKKGCTENMILEPEIMEARQQALKILREECFR